MLKDYSKNIYEFSKNNTLYSVIRASVEGQYLQIHIVEYQRWQRNSQTGIVEELYTLDQENTKKFCERFRITTSPNLVRILKREFGQDGMLWFLDNFREYCYDHNIKYEHQD